MSEITLEKLHSLLEGLAEHMMNNLPTKQEMNERFEQVDARFDKVESRLEKVETDVDQIKVDIHHMKGDILQTKIDIKSIMKRLDAQEV